MKAAESGDFATAYKEWKPLAEQGNVDAQYNLGVLYSSGQGVAQDFSESVRWYQMAAKQGDASAQYNLGLMYYFGEGVLQDYSEAARWYRLTAQQGDAWAQCKHLPPTPRAYNSRASARLAY